MSEIAQRFESAIFTVLAKDASCLPQLNLQASDFHHQATAAIFTHIERLHRYGVQPDVVTLWQAMQEHGEFNLFSGGFGEFSSWFDGVGAVQNAKFYAGKIKEEAQKRSLLSLARALANVAIEGEGEVPVKELVRQVREAFVEFETQTELVHTGLDASASVDECLQELQEIWARDGNLVGITTGLKKLDAMTMGLQNGDLIIVSGRPSMGKTLLAQHLSISAAKVGAKTHFVTLEMPRTRLMRRFFASLADVPSSEIVSGKFTSRANMQAFEDATRFYRTLPITLHHETGTVEKICSLARRERLKGGIDLLVIDQLSAIYCPGENRATGLKHITGALKTLAKELNIPVVLLHQINREAAKFGDKRPDIHQLKDSGAVEEDADVVLMIHRPSYYDNSLNPEEAEIIAGKNREGEKGQIAAVGVNLGTSKFSDYPPSWDPRQVQQAESEKEFI